MNIEAVLRDLEAAPCGAGGVPEGAEDADMRLLEAARKDLLEFLGLLFTLFGTRSGEGCHSVRSVQLLTALGWAEFAEFLEGAGAVDRHFAEAEGADNLPLRAAFADQYYTRLRGCQTRAVFAYDERMDLFPDYLQQLEMESNGKSVLVDGSPVTGPTAPITWGGVGTDAQHAVFQLLHQGTNLVPVDFIAAIAPGDDLDPAHHRILLMNCFAQGAALMAGKASDDSARAYPGDRPSATILLDELNPASLGALIAFHEHRTFANAVLLGINPFDQFGVELGKQIANAIEQGGVSFDPSTDALLKLAGIA